MDRVTSILLPVADDRSDDSGIPSLLVTPTVHNRSYKSPPPAPVLSQMNPVHTLTLFLLDLLKITLLRDVTSCKRQLYKYTRLCVAEESNVHSNLNVILTSALGSWGSSVGVVTRMRARWPKSLGLIAGDSKRFVSVSRWGPPSLFFGGYRRCFSGGNAAGTWSWSLTSIQPGSWERVELYL
jgi:hypothetical protein